MITDWTDTRVGLLKQFFEAGDAYSMIAVKINMKTGTSFTRGAISGKIDREKLTRVTGMQRSNQTPRRQRQKLTRMVLGKGKSGSWRNGPSLPAEPIPAPVIFTDEHKCTLFDLKNNSCRFPLWDGDMPFHDKFFCGAPEADFDDRKPFCHFHSAVAYRPVQVREAAE